MWKLLKQLTVKKIIITLDTTLEELELINYALKIPTEGKKSYFSPIAHFISVVYWRYPPAGNETSNSWQHVSASTEHSSIPISRSICSSRANLSYAAMGVVSVSSTFSSLEPPVVEVPAWLPWSAFILEKRKHIKTKPEWSRYIFSHAKTTTNTLFMPNYDVAANFPFVNGRCHFKDN